MKNYLKPLSITFMASLICVSSANALDLGVFDPRNIGKKIGGSLNPGRKQSQPVQSQNQQRAQQTNYPKMAAASAQLNGAIGSVLSTSQTQMGQTALDLTNLRGLYSVHGNRAFWTNDTGLNEMGLALYDLLTQSSEVHGFEADYYLTDDVVARLGARDLNSIAELDVLLTQGYMLFIKDMSTGRINPRDASQGLGDIEMRKNPAPSLAAMNSITTDPDTLFAGIERFAPAADGYHLLISSLAKLRMGVQAGGWRTFTADRAAIKPGDSHANIVSIRERLVDMGYMRYDARKNKSLQYDPDTVRAVMRFQELNFLGADGVIGPSTYKAMDFTIQKAINQTRANLEKWRFMPRSFPSRYLFVDMGRQELDIMENNQLVDRMRVVVGKDLNGTPTMTDQVTSMILSPYWHPPRSIIIKEIIPKMMANPNYLTNNRMRILRNGQDVDPSTVNWSQYTMENPPPFLFRQDSGPENSLGLVKFDLTNAHSIYMHDTDNHSVFQRDIRYLSHGCIRLERPFDLAAYLMRDQGNQAEELKMIASDQNTHALKVSVTPIPVYIFGTTMVNYADGPTTFGTDVYGQDDRIIKALDQMARPASAAAALKQN